MKRYSAERKEAVIRKMLPPLNMSVADLVREEGISDRTLYHWRSESISRGVEMPHIFTHQIAERYPIRVFKSGHFDAIILNTI
jgi:hypothetical protein